MKRKIRIAALLITGALAIASLVGCTEGTSSKDGSQDYGSAAKDDSISTYIAQIEHYEELIKDLEKDLLNEKEENYIKTAEYRQKIAELEKSILLLSDKSDTEASSQGGLVLENQGDYSDDRKEESDEIKPPAQLSTSFHFSTATVEGGCVVNGYGGNATELVIPSEINGTRVVGIGEAAFKDSGITKLTLPDTVTDIDWFAFSNCKSLREIYIPSSVTFIGHGAFDGCSQDLVIVCEPGSYAEAYAISWGIAHSHP